MYNNGNSSKNVTGATIVDGTITNNDIDSNAAIATSKISGLKGQCHNGNQYTFADNISGSTSLFINKASGGSSLSRYYWMNNSTGYSILHAAAFTVTSDYRTKENVAPLTGAIERLSALAPYTFNYKDGSLMPCGNNTVDGFLAHEVQAVVPESVIGDKDAVDSDGNPDYQGIDQSKLVPLLVSALQEAITRIEQLENN
jgi:hypothetical protein